MLPSSLQLRNPADAEERVHFKSKSEMILFCPLTGKHVIIPQGETENASKENRPPFFSNEDKFSKKFPDQKSGFKIFPLLQSLVIPAICSW